MDWMKVWGKRIMVMGGLIIMVLLVTDFNSRMAELTRLQAQETEELQHRQDLFATQNVLETQIGYANSDAAVEAWAREQARSALDGDFPVVPLADPDYEPPVEEAPEIEPEQHTHWENWMLWLFGTNQANLP